MYRLKEVGKEPSDWRFSNAKHGKGSVSHQWKISWHFRMHLLHANLWFQRKMTPDERDVLWDPAGRWGEWTPGPLKRGQWCQPSANVQPQQHPVVRSGHHTSSRKGYSQLPQIQLAPRWSSDPLVLHPHFPFHLHLQAGYEQAETQTDRKAGRLEFSTLICARDGVFCVLAHVWASLILL